LLRGRKVLKNGKGPKKKRKKKQAVASKGKDKKAEGGGHHRDALETTCWGVAPREGEEQTSLQQGKKTWSMQEKRGRGSTWFFGRRSKPKGGNNAESSFLPGPEKEPN